MSLRANLLTYRRPIGLREWKRNVDVANSTNLGQEYGIHVRVMLEPLQDAHPFNLTGPSMNVRFAQLLCVCLNDVSAHG